MILNKYRLYESSPANGLPMDKYSPYQVFYDRNDAELRNPRHHYFEVVFASNKGRQAFKKLLPDYIIENLDREYDWDNMVRIWYDTRTEYNLYEKILEYYCQLYKIDILSADEYDRLAAK